MATRRRTKIHRASYFPENVKRADCTSNRLVYSRETHSSFVAMIFVLFFHFYLFSSPLPPLFFLISFSCSNTPSPPLWRMFFVRIVNSNHIEIYRSIYFDHMTKLTYIRKHVFIDFSFCFGEPMVPYDFSAGDRIRVLIITRLVHCAAYIILIAVFTFFFLSVAAARKMVDRRRDFPRLKSSRDTTLRSAFSPFHLSIICSVHFGDCTYI